MSYLPSRSCAIPASHASTNPRHPKAVHSKADPVTALGNRAALLKSLADATAAHDRTLPSALLILDLDNFRLVNHSMGEDAGDEILQVVASRLAQALPTGSPAFRIGGNEFAIVLVDIHFDRTEDPGHFFLRYARSLQASVQAPYQFQHTETQTIHRTGASVGVALIAEQQAEKTTVLDRAGLALKEAKRLGGGCSRLYRPHLALDFGQQRELETRLRGAIQSRELELHYQAQVDEQGRPVGAEALLRWEIPGIGFIAPGTFILLAEKIGLIHQLGEIVISQACHQLAKWSVMPSPFPDLTLAINISPLQLHDAGLYEQIYAELAQTGAKPDKLKLEITESAVLHNLSAARMALERLDKLGVRISLDDFGTGYTSFSYLKELPISEIKIDRSFIENVDSQKYDDVITQTILGLGRMLGLSVIAEGFENQSQVECLQKMGCERYQGYLFAYPKSPIKSNRYISDYSAI